MPLYRLEVEQAFKYELFLDADTMEDAENAAVQSRIQGGPNSGAALVRHIRSRLMEQRVEIVAVGEVV